MIMEIRLKERLVGAMVLMLAAVIFIPMVLDGPNADRRVSQNIALPDPASNDARRTVRLDLDAATMSAPAVAESSAESPAGSGELASIDLVPIQEKAAAEAEKSAPSVTENREPATQKPQPVSGKPADDAPWTVQAGSFGSDDNAEALAAKLRKLGYPAYVSRYNDGKRTHYRVRVGGFPSRDAAQLKADEIRTKTGEPAAPVQSR